jgi:hypothetical protein
MAASDKMVKKFVLTQFSRGGLIKNQDARFFKIDLIPLHLNLGFNLYFTQYVKIFFVIFG